MIKQYHIQDQAEIIPGKDEILIRPVTSSPREGWGEALAAMHQRGEDALLVDDMEPEDNVVPSRAVVALYSTLEGGGI